MRKLLTALAISLQTACALAAVPLRFNADAAHPATHQDSAYRGETIDIEARLLWRGAPLEVAPGAGAALYWQTNGMGSAWWTAPASVTTSGVVSAVWSPTNDVGAAAYRLFLGVADGGANYRANMLLRMIDAPGAEPNTLAPPLRTIDFSTVAVENAPWIEEEADPAFSEWVDTITNQFGIVGFADSAGSTHDSVYAQLAATMMVGGKARTGDDILNYTASAIAATYLSRDEAVSGFTEWTITPNPCDGETLEVKWWTFVIWPDQPGWVICCKNGPMRSTIHNHDPDATNVVWTADQTSFGVSVTATRTRFHPSAAMEAAWDAKADPETVTNIVRDMSLGGIWDEQIQVWWTPRMRNGSLTYEATTNVNLNAED